MENVRRGFWGKKEKCYVGDDDSWEREFLETFVVILKKCPSIYMWLDLSPAFLRRCFSTATVEPAKSADIPSIFDIHSLGTWPYLKLCPYSLYSLFSPQPTTYFTFGFWFYKAKVIQILCQWRYNAAQLPPTYHCYFLLSKSEKYLNKLCKILKKFTTREFPQPHQWKMKIWVLV